MAKKCPKCKDYSLDFDSSSNKWICCWGDCQCQFTDEEVDKEPKWDFNSTNEQHIPPKKDGKERMSYNRSLVREKK